MVMLVKTYYVLGSIGYALKPVCGDDVGVLDAYGSNLRDYKLWLKGNHVVELQDVLGAWSYYRELVYLDAYAVTYESCFLGMAHEVVFKAVLCHNLDCAFVQL